MSVRFSRIKRGLWCTLALLLTFFKAGSSRVQGQAASPPTTIMDTTPAVRALCGKHVALLGEAGIHGFGNTLDFKVQLVRRLVDECHFNALFIESGLYDYIHIHRNLRTGQDVSEAMISAAIGGLWANKEVQSLVPFLHFKVKAGSLTLGGLDDQIGRGTYASRGMLSDLVQPLQEGEQARCLAILQRHMLGQYTRDAKSPADKVEIFACLNEIQARVSSAKQTKSDEETAAMVDSLKRNFARDFTEDDLTRDNDRERSMYLKLKSQRNQLRLNSKIIVWAATVHTAKDLNGVPGSENRVPLGLYIHEEFRDDAFSLGFAAYSGAYAFTHSPVRELSGAPPGSLESQTFSHTDAATVYLSRKQLRKFNAVPARLFGTDFRTARWDQVVDGLVVFRQERAPAWITLAK